jgi:hypothetical protein
MPVKGYRKLLCERGHRMIGQESGRSRCMECRREAASRARTSVHPPRKRKPAPRNLPIQIGATPVQMAAARAELAAWDATQVGKGPLARSAAARAQKGLAR